MGNNLNYATLGALATSFLLRYGCLDSVVPNVYKDPDVVREEREAHYYHVIFPQVQEEFARFEDRYAAVLSGDYMTDLFGFVVERDGHFMYVALIEGTVREIYNTRSEIQRAMFTGTATRTAAITGIQSSVRAIAPELEDQLTLEAMEFLATHGLDVALSDDLYEMVQAGEILLILTDQTLDGAMIECVAEFNRTRYRRRIYIDRDLRMDSLDGGVARIRELFEQEYGHAMSHISVQTAVDEHLRAVPDTACADNNSPDNRFARLLLDIELDPQTMFSLSSWLLLIPSSNVVEETNCEDRELYVWFDQEYWYICDALYELPTTEQINQVSEFYNRAVESDSEMMNDDVYDMLIFTIEH